LHLILCLKFVEAVNVDDEYGEFVKVKKSGEEPQQHPLKGKRKYQPEIELYKSKKGSAKRFLQGKNPLSGSENDSEDLNDLTVGTDLSADESVSDAEDSMNEREFSATEKEGEKLEESENDNEFFDSLKTDSKPLQSLQLVHQQSLQKCQVVKEQLKRLDVAYKLRILLQKILQKVNEDQIKDTTEALASFRLIRKQIHALYDHDQDEAGSTNLGNLPKTWYAWIEPWYTTTHLSSQLKATNQLKVIGNQHSANTFKDVIAWALRDQQKWMNKSGLSRQCYDDSDFYQSLLKDILSAKVLPTGDANLTTNVTNASQYTKSKTKLQKDAYILGKTHDKLISFMAPFPVTVLWDSERMDQLYAALPQLSHE
jgi:Apoptosis-antagonizing transcription factor, C-terminal